MKKILMISVVVTVLGACGSSYYNSTPETRHALDTMVEKRAFNIESSWAEPQVTNAMQQLGQAGLLPSGSTVGNIDISSSTNFFRIANDSVKAILPFFGERHFGGAYSNASGIEFEDIPNDLHIRKGDKYEYGIRFSIHDKNSHSENYQVYIKLFSNLTSIININSTQRNNIQYRGNVSALNMEKQ